MNLKQQRFCEEYLISGNATQAAIKAGYSKRTARSIGAENLTKPDIISYIQEQSEKISSKKIASAEEVLQYLTKGLRQELDEEVMLSDGTKARKQISLKDSNKCAELLAKRYGLLTEKVTVEGNVPVVISGGDDLADQ